MTDVTPLNLGLPGFTYADLYDPRRLQDLSDSFDAELATRVPALFNEFEIYRACRGDGMKPEEVSDSAGPAGARTGRFPGATLRGGA